MKISAWREKMVFLMIGILSVLAILFLTAANNIQPVGKYQMECVVRNNFTDVYVIDTTTGVVKWVDDMNTPFEKMKGK
ncbi:MAG: hypothetical protein QNI95_03320 [Desulfobacterales bacterium]|nr:hypothetical protein [Desulfobacterales bacterium]